MLSVVDRGGLYLPDCGLWMDPRAESGICAAWYSNAADEAAGFSQHEELCGGDAADGSSAAAARVASSRDGQWLGAARFEQISLPNGCRAVAFQQCGQQVVYSQCTDCGRYITHCVR